MRGSKLNSLDDSGFRDNLKNSAGKFERRANKSKTEGPYNSSRSRNQDEEDSDRSKDS